MVADDFLRCTHAKGRPLNSIAIQSSEQPRTDEVDPFQSTRERQLLTYVHLPKAGGNSAVTAIQDSEILSQVDLLPRNPDRYALMETLRKPTERCLFTTFHAGELFPAGAVSNQDLRFKETLRTVTLPMSTVRRPRDVFVSLVRYFWDLRERSPEYWHQAVAEGSYPDTGDPNEVFARLLSARQSGTTLWPLVTCNFFDNPVKDLVFFAPSLRSLYAEGAVSPRKLVAGLHRDYVYLGAMEHLDKLLELCADTGLIPAASTLKTLNTSSRDSTSALRPAYVRILEETWCPWWTHLWKLLQQVGPIGSPGLLLNWLRARGYGA